MHDSFDLRVVTPQRALLEEEVREVTAPGTVGEFGVLPDHITFLTSLEVGTMSYRTDRGTYRIAIRGGFAEVVDNVMTVLADDAVFAEDIDADAARTELSTAEAQLRDLSPLEESFQAVDDQRRWAQARIEAASAAR